MCLQIPPSPRQMHFSQHLFCLPICPNQSPERPLKITSSLCTLHPFHLHCWEGWRLQWSQDSSVIRTPARQTPETQRTSELFVTITSLVSHSLILQSVHDKVFYYKHFLIVHFGEWKQFCEMKRPRWMLLSLVLPAAEMKGMTDHLFTDVFQLMDMKNY